ncbi:hypothetical protein A9257_06780 [Vibrio cyclitrophicus]|uniref:DUF4062 domain-containing protein n=1 Tax=Vibrio cyclitrophicus TaxID=47951 RepID=UPI0007EEC140|nr:DUF4062 domain-containing protein [Vibrio cyclitrophicus]OBT00389.1 hypothetical protein A9257_06780 [Vibrio cyclitrophicus]
MKKKYSVFISSTFIDLEEERETIRKLVIDMGYIPLGMESFPATNEEQFGYIQKVIDDCDYYILVIGGRYGSMTEDGVSYTEKEYDYAVAKDKVVLAFVHESPGDFPAKVTDSDPSLKKKLDTFRRKATDGRVVKFWSNKDQLGYQAMTSLHQAVDNYPTIGWVRGDFQDTQEVSQEFRRAEGELFHLKHEANDLRKKMADYESLIYSQFIEKTKPATNAEMKAWVDGAKNNYDDPTIRQRHNVRYAETDFILPSLYGAHSVAVIVEKGVKVYQSQNGGHSEVYYMDGFRKDGI